MYRSDSEGFLRIADAVPSNAKYVAGEWSTNRHASVIVANQCKWCLIRDAITFIFVSHRSSAFCLTSVSHFPAFEFQNVSFDNPSGRGDVGFLRESRGHKWLLVTQCYPIDVLDGTTHNMYTSLFSLVCISWQRRQLCVVIKWEFVTFVTFL